MLEEIRLAGISPFTTIDFPKRRAAVLFLQGCGWHCSHCHSAWMQARERQPDTPDWPDALAWLADRRGLLDGVVLSGGEPLLQLDLPAAIGEIHSMGFEVALHTSGAYPERLAAILPTLAWVGLDFKMPFARYAELTGVAAGEKVRAAMQALTAHGGSFEIRSTIDASIHNMATLQCMRDELLATSVKLSHWVLQARHHKPDHVCQASLQLARDAAMCFGLQLKD